MSVHRLPNTWRITYVREDWSRPWELEDYDDAKTVDLGEQALDDLLEGLLPGRYEARHPAFLEDAPITFIVAPSDHAIEVRSPSP